MSLMDLLLSGPSASDRYQAVTSLLSGGGIDGGISSAGGDPGATGSPSQWENRARRYFENRLGYSPADFNKVDYIIEHESGWNPNALNQSSGAWGIPQILPMEGRPERGTLSPMQQIKWLADYLNSHDYPGYGSGVDAAYQFKLANGWY